MRLWKETVNKKLPLLFIVLLVGGVVTFLLLRTNPGSSDSLPSEDVAAVVTHSTDTPSEEKPGKDYKWKGGPTDPKKIIVPSLGIDGYIQNVGVDQHGEVAVPNNIHLAGWFVDSVRPGDAGLSIIDGHVDLRPNRHDAVFQHLNTIKQDAEVSVVFGDDSVKKFKVVQVQDVPLDEAASILYSSQPNATHQLNLITCSGAYDASTDRLDHRVIVSTELLQSSS